MGSAITDEIGGQYVTEGGINISRSRNETPYDGAIEAYLDQLDSRRGAIFSSNYEYPGRYTRWDTAIVDPPVMIAARGRAMEISALNRRGEVILPVLSTIIETVSDATITERTDDKLLIQIDEPGRIFTEEERSRMPSVFSVLRAIVTLFKSEEDPNLGLYGAFGYDLAFQFDPVDPKLERPESQRDLVLYLPDEILVVDHHSAKAWHDRYDYSGAGWTTNGLERGGGDEPFETSQTVPPRADHEPGEYAKLVEKAKKSFLRGDLFEVVPGQMFYERCESKPSQIARRLKTINPSRTRFSSIWASANISSVLPRKCLSASMAGGSKHARFPARSGAETMQSPIPSKSLNCSTPKKTNPS